MKYLGLYTSIICLIIGIIIGSNWSSGQIEEVKVVEYVTRWKVEKTQIGFEQALGCLYSPLIIDHTIVDNTVFIHSYDKCKENKKEVEMKVVNSDDWNVYFAIAGVSLAAGLASSIYLLK